MVNLNNIFPSSPVGAFAIGMILGCISTAYNKPVGITITMIISFMILIFYAKYGENKDANYTEGEKE